MAVSGNSLCSSQLERTSDMVAIASNVIFFVSFFILLIIVLFCFSYLSVVLHQSRCRYETNLDLLSCNHSLSASKFSIHPEVSSSVHSPHECRLRTYRYRSPENHRFGCSHGCFSFWSHKVYRRCPDPMYDNFSRKIEGRCVHKRHIRPT